MLPFALADAARLQLDFLSHNKALPAVHRDSIAKWLRGYNNRLVKWLHENYGPEGVKAADAMSRSVGRAMFQLQSEAQAQTEREIFGRLEEEMNGED